MHGGSLLKMDGATKYGHFKASFLNCYPDKFKHKLMSMSQQDIYKYKLGNFKSTQTFFLLQPFYIRQQLKMA